MIKLRRVFLDDFPGLLGLGRGGDAIPFDGQYLLQQFTDVGFVIYGENVFLHGR